MKINSVIIKQSLICSMHEAEQGRVLVSKENQAAAEERGHAAAASVHVAKVAKQVAAELDQLERAKREYKKKQIAASDPAKTASLLARYSRGWSGRAIMPWSSGCTTWTTIH